MKRSRAWDSESSPSLQSTPSFIRCIKSARFEEIERVIETALVPEVLKGILQSNRPIQVDVRASGSGTVLRPGSSSTVGSTPAASAAVDAEKVAKRQKQIDLGKNTIGYMRYCSLIPRGSRRPRIDPQTPDPHAAVPKRLFDGQMRSWRRALHEYDVLVLPDAQVVEALSVREAGGGGREGGGGDEALPIIKRPDGLVVARVLSLEAPQGHAGGRRLTQELLRLTWGSDYERIAASYRTEIHSTADKKGGAATKTTSVYRVPLSAAGEDNI